MTNYLSLTKMNLRFKSTVYFYLTRWLRILEFYEIKHCYKDTECVTIFITKFLNTLEWNIYLYIYSLYIINKQNARKQARPTAQHGYFSNYHQAPFCIKCLKTLATHYILTVKATILTYVTKPKDLPYHPHSLM